MHACCYGQSWCKYWIHIVARTLICKIYVIESWTEGWSDSHTGWAKSYLSKTQGGSTKNLDGNVACFRNRYRYVHHGRIGL
jgi:hypothetical protein